MTGQDRQNIQGCTGRACHVGLHLLHFSPVHTLYCFMCVVCLFLAFWAIWKAVMQRCRSWAHQAIGCATIIFAWSSLFSSLQPHHPYWLSELSVMLIVCSGLKMLDFLVWQDFQAQNLPYSSLVLDYALVLRPESLQFKLGQRKPVGRSLLERVKAAAKPLGWALLQMCGCEAMNAWLMHHETSDILDAPYLYQCLTTVTLASALYLHLSYFFYSVVALAVVLFDQDPISEWPPLFDSPWLSSSPSDFWNRRWHQMFRHGFVRLAFYPTKLALLWLLEDQKPQACLPSLKQSKVEEDAGSDPQGSSTPTTPGGRYALRPRKEKATPTPLRPGKAPAVDPPCVTAVVHAQPTSHSTTPQRRRKSAQTALTKADTDMNATISAVATTTASGLSVGMASGKASSPLASALLQILPPFSVFLFSGLLHEFLLLVFFGAPTGHQLAFFMVHALALLLQRLVRKARSKCSNTTMESTAPAARIKAHARHFACMLAWSAFLFLTTPLFMRPWILYNYHKELRVLLPGPIHYLVKRCMQA